MSRKKKPRPTPPYPGPRRVTPVPQPVQEVGAPTSAANSFLFPSGNTHVNVAATQALNVLASLISADYSRVKAQCYQTTEPAAPSDAYPDDATDGYASLTRVGTSNRFRGPVPVTNFDIEATRPMANNIWIVAHAYNDNTSQWEKIGNVNFVAYVPATQTVSVGAKNAIWFAWADAGFVGPQGEAGDDYRPRRVLIPTNATSVTIEPDDSVWMSGINGKDSNGADVELGLAVPSAYQNSTYHSDAIEDLALRLFSLVCMFATDSATPSTQTPMFAGSSLGSGGTFTFTGVKYLLLAFHDAGDWTDNEFSIDVKLTWS